MADDASLSSPPQTTGLSQFVFQCECFILCRHSDQMGNKGAFITLGKDLKPQFTTYEAVVGALHHHYII